MKKTSLFFIFILLLMLVIPATAASPDYESSDGNKAAYKTVYGGTPSSDVYTSGDNDASDPKRLRYVSYLSPADETGVMTPLKESSKAGYVWLAIDLQDSQILESVKIWAAATDYTSDNWNYSRHIKNLNVALFETFDVNKAQELLAGTDKTELGTTGDYPFTASTPAISFQIPTDRAFRYVVLYKYCDGTGDGLDKARIRVRKVEAFKHAFLRDYSSGTDELQSYTMPNGKQYAYLGYSDKVTSEAKIPSVYQVNAKQAIVKAPSAYTLSATFRIVYPTAGRIFGTENTSLSLDENGNLVFNYLSGTEKKSLTTTIEQNKWYTASASFDGANAALYLNGELKQSSSNESGIQSDTATLALGNGVCAQILRACLNRRAFAAQDATAYFNESSEILGDCADKGQLEIVSYEKSVTATAGATSNGYPLTNFTDKNTAENGDAALVGGTTSFGWEDITKEIRIDLADSVIPAQLIFYGRPGSDDSKTYSKDTCSALFSASFAEQDNNPTERSVIAQVAPTGVTSRVEYFTAKKLPAVRYIYMSREQGKSPEVLGGIELVVIGQRQSLSDEILSAAVTEGKLQADVSAKNGLSGTMLLGVYKGKKLVRSIDLGKQSVTAGIHTVSVSNENLQISDGDEAMLFFWNDTESCIPLVKKYPIK